jgi:hypothetical protein
MRMKVKVNHPNEMNKRLDICFSDGRQGLNSFSCVESDGGALSDKI